MSLKDKRVLVTGGAGFIGSHVRDELLEAGCETTIFDDLSTGRIENLKPSLKEVFVRGNIQNFEALKRFVKDQEVVIHCAAQVSTFRAIDNPVLDFNINALGTFNLFEACRQANDKTQIIYTSSRSVYGNILEPIIVDENTPTNPMNSFYPLHKLYGEQLAKLYHELYGMKCVIIQPANVVGSRQPNVGNAYNFVSYWVSRVLRNKPIPIFGTGQQIRDYVDVRDIARAYRLCIEKESDYNKFLLASGGSASLIGLANMITALINIYSGGIEYFPQRKGDIMRFVGNSTRAERELGWKRQYTLEQTLRDTIAYVKQNLDYYDME